jgi:uncharacterized membrane protein YqhA
MFEALLWKSRLVALIAVVASVVVSLVMFYVASIDVLSLRGHVLHYHQMDLAHDARVTMRAEIVSYVVEVVDGYLLAAIMLIFALGLYELFISRIDIAEGSEFAKRHPPRRPVDDYANGLSIVICRSADSHVRE